MSGNYFFQVSKSLKEDKIKIIKKRTKMLSTIFHNKFVTIVKHNWQDKVCCAGGGDQLQDGLSRLQCWWLVLVNNNLLVNHIKNMIVWKCTSWHISTIRIMNMIIMYRSDLSEKCLILTSKKQKNKQTKNSAVKCIFIEMEVEASLEPYKIFKSLFFIDITPKMCSL
jgi:hypothetical protein